MAMLVSPSNNTGWGAACKTMYGGAKVLSEHHPVRVLAHYRASWGSRKGRVVRRRPMRITNDPVADVVNAIGPGRGRRRKGRRIRMRITNDPVADVVNAIGPGRRRKGRKGRRMRITNDPVMDVVNAIGPGRRRKGRKGRRVRKGVIVRRNKRGHRTIIVKEASKRGTWSKLPRAVMYHPDITANPARYQKRKYPKVKKVIYPKVRYPPMPITNDPVADVVNAVAAATAARPATTRAERHTKMRITADPVADVVNAIAAGTARRRANADARRRRAREALQNARRNIYLVRNAAGVRVPQTTRPA